MAKRLELQFDNGIIQLEYIPEKLSYSDTVSTNTIPTIGGSTSFIAPQDAIRTDYNIVARVYQADRTETNTTEAYVGVAAGAGLAIGAQFLNESEYRAARNTIVLARGVYDISSDILMATTNFFDSSAAAKGIDKINILRENMKLGVPCVINWDLDDTNLVISDDNQTKYLLTRLDVQAVTIQEETLTTIAYELNMSLVNQGNQRVEVRN